MPRMLRAVPVVLILASLVSLLAARGGQTVPVYAAYTSLQCGSCHFDPNGGGPRNELGFGYARNRHSLEPEDSASEWHDLAVVNRLGDAVPIYLGTNQRVLLLTNTTVESDSLDRLAFFNMESALHLAFQPHRRLTLVYTRDGGGFGQISRTQEAFGMLAGLPWDGYLKAGRFRTPFGLRQDDHTVATRNGFLDFQGGGRVLPYDPRTVDTGLEIGLERAGWFGRFAFTNGSADLFAGQFAETKTLKLGYNASHYQGAVSLYDQFSKVTFGLERRQARWGYYGMTHWRQLALVAELAAGTDEWVTGEKKNRLACMAELNYAPRRSLNFRLRYDRLELDRATDAAVRDANTHHRYSVEGEYVPVPFAELRWTLRKIEHEDEVGFGFPNENQAYLQFHFAY